MAKQSDRALAYVRAGEWTRNEVRGLQREYLKRHWRVFATGLLLGLIPIAMLLVLPSSIVHVWLRSFFAGAWLAGLIAALWFVVFLGSGTAAMAIGADAERWTARELRACRGLGWWTASHVEFSGYDVDHVVLGPSGVVVVETKWTSEERLLDREGSLNGAVTQVLRNARTVGLWIAGRNWQERVHPVLVYWGPRLGEELRAAPHTVDGVTVMAGDQLADWIESLPEMRVGERELDEMREKIEEYVPRRDTKTKRDPYPSALECVVFAGAAVGLALLCFLGVFLAGSRLGTGAGVALGLGAALLSIVLVGHYPRFRVVCFGALAGSLVAVVLYLTVSSLR